MKENTRSVAASSARLRGCSNKFAFFTDGELAAEPLPLPNQNLPTCAHSRDDVVMRVTPFQSTWKSDAEPALLHDVIDVPVSRGKPLLAEIYPWWAQSYSCRFTLVWIVSPT
jgi:hypothetical protein